LTGVEKIKERILADAEQKAAEIIADAKKQAEEIISKAKAEAVRRSEEIHKQSENEANQRKRIVNSMTELEIRKNVLATKQEVIEKVFDEVLNRLNALKGKELEEILFPMLMASVESGDEEVIVSEQDMSKISSEFIEKVNAALKKKGKKGELKLTSGKIHSTGGFILKGKGVEINNSFEALLRMKRDEIESIVAESLF